MRKQSILFYIEEAEDGEKGRGCGVLVIRPDHYRSL